MIDNRVRKIAAAAGSLVGENRELVDAEMLLFSTRDRAGSVVYTVKLRVDYSAVSERLTKRDQRLIAKHENAKTLYKA